MLVVVSVTIAVVIPALLLVALLIWRVRRRSMPASPRPTDATIVQRWLIQDKGTANQIGLLLEVVHDANHTYFAEAVASVPPGEAGRWIPGATIHVTVAATNLADVSVTSLASQQPADFDEVMRAVARRAEAVNEHTRRNGKPGVGVVVGARNSGILIPDNGYLQRLTLDVQPEAGSPFRADTILIIPGSREPRFRPGARLNVRFQPSGLQQVAVDVSGASAG